MNSVHTRIATLANFPHIAALVEHLNRDPQTQCIHSGTGESAGSMVAEMEKWHASGEILFVIALEDDRVIGALGCEFERDGQRGWLRGPFLINPLEAASTRMYNLLRDELPPGICRLDSFLNIENRRGQAFYELMDFELKGRSHVYVAALPDQVRRPPKVNGLDCALLDDATQARFIALHDHIFPETYYNGAQIIEQLDENHKVWVYAQPDGSVLGYINAIIEPWAEEGYVEFLGVREDARAQGIGGALLATALAWFFRKREMPQVGLTVSDENVNARGLYEWVGFRLQYTGVNHRLEWD